MHDLVSFDKPPVAEVALSVQFASDSIDVEVLGLFSREVRAELPVRQRQPMALPMVETFGRVPAMPSFEIHLEGPTSLPRTLFLSEDGVQLVQLQHDRLTFNWRELDREVEYPRYEQLRERFAVLLERLLVGLREAGVTPFINLCEVTYVNPIEYGAHDAATEMHPDLAKVINRVNARPDDAFLPEAEDAQLNARWRIPGGDGQSPAGRLYLAASPGLKPPQGVPIYLVNLTARVIPSSGSTEDAMKALDLGHEWVVLGFKDLTTTEMHEQWGLKEATQ